MNTKTPKQAFDEAVERKIWINKANKFMIEFISKQEFKNILLKLNIDYIDNGS